MSKSFQMEKNVYVKDIDEYEEHGKKWDYPDEIDLVLKEHIKILVDWINEEKGPFTEGYVDLWYNRYKELTGKK